MSISSPTAGNNAQEETDAPMIVPDSAGVAGGNSNSPATVEEEAPKVLEESPLAKPVPKKLCGVCNENEPKYKCSRCYLPYCSVACSTIHKATHPAEEPRLAVEPKTQSEPRAKAGPARPGTVSGAANSSPQGPFAALDESKELQELFKKYPRLRTLLDRINKATLPPINNNAQQNQNGGKRKEQPWNSDRGLQKGIQVLNDMRNTGSKDGKAVREFSNLILRILSQQEGISARDAVEKEVAQENQKIIEQLLNGEL